MKRPAIELVLNEEFQEFYLACKQWLADIAFLESEEAFLNKLLVDYSVGEQRTFRERLNNAALTHKNLGKAVTAFINTLDMLIIKSAKCLDANTIEKFTSLQATVGNALAMLKGIKYAMINARQVA